MNEWNNRKIITTIKEPSLKQKNVFNIKKITCFVLLIKFIKSKEKRKLYYTLRE